MQLRAHFDHASGDIILTIIPERDESIVAEMGPDPTIKGMMVLIDGDAGPLLRLPFHFHGKRLHTVCIRDGD